MKENIINFLKELKLTNELITFIISMLPIVELRGSIPIAILKFKMPVLKSFLISVIGNLVPVLPIIYFLEPIRKFLSRIIIFKKFFDWLYERVYRKSEKNIQKYGAIGLAIFVAIPLPGTGAWTGSIAAILFNIKTKYSFPAITVGVIIAGIIVSIIVKGLTIWH
jgi:uncharacterized membrane protein